MKAKKNEVVEVVKSNTPKELFIYEVPGIPYPSDEGNVCFPSQAKALRDFAWRGYARQSGQRGEGQVSGLVKLVRYERREVKIFDVDIKEKVNKE